MKGTNFPEANALFGAPVDWDDQKMGGPCLGLPVFNDGTQLISRWELTWRDRLAILFGAPVWLYITGQQHPVVGFNVQKTIFS